MPALAGFGFFVLATVFLPSSPLGIDAIAGGPGRVSDTVSEPRLDLTAGSIIVNSPTASTLQLAHLDGTSRWLSVMGPRPESKGLSAHRAPFQKGLRIFA